mmetsp:Transcript_114312/g.272056  ORF Transcript_114312/g.272056 Transcript_114312/m.272056 type:complete len:349 (+) Transcript_114312:57-1103(+)
MPERHPRRMVVCKSKASGAPHKTEDTRGVLVTPRETLLKLSGLRALFRLHSIGRALLFGQLLFHDHPLAVHGPRLTRVDAIIFESQLSVPLDRRRIPHVNSEADLRELPAAIQRCLNARIHQLSAEAKTPVAVLDLDVSDLDRLLGLVILHVDVAENFAGCRIHSSKHILAGIGLLLVCEQLHKALLGIDLLLLDANERCPLPRAGRKDELREELRMVLTQLALQSTDFRCCSHGRHLDHEAILGRVDLALTWKDLPAIAMRLVWIDPIPQVIIALALLRAQTFETFVDGFWLPIRSQALATVWSFCRRDCDATSCLRCVKRLPEDGICIENRPAPFVVLVVQIGSMA